MKASDLVSVVIPTFNRVNVLSRAVDSVRNQTYENWELFIVDDGSTDGTEQMVKQKYGSDDRIHFLKRPESRPKGANACRNIGIEKANGEYIAFLDSDDEWHNDHLEKKVVHLKKTEADGAFSGYIMNFKTYLGKEKSHSVQKNIPEYKSTGKIGNYLLENDSTDIGTPTIVIKKEPARNIKFDEKLQQGQEYDFAIRFDQKFKLITESTITVNIYYDSNERMSSKLDHKSKMHFLENNSEFLSLNAKGQFLFNLARHTVFMEGKTDDYYFYREKLLKFDKSLYWRSRLALIDLPILGSILLFFWKKYLEYKLH